MVDEIRRRVDERLSELQPAIDEYRELMAVKRGLSEAGNDPLELAEPVLAGATASPARDARATARRPRRSTSRGGGTRAEQAITIVGDRPGVTVNEIAAEMGINQNYLYRLLPRMEREGRLRREGRGWALPVA